MHAQLITQDSIVQVGLISTDFGTKIDKVASLMRMMAPEQFQFTPIQSPEVAEQLLTRTEQPLDLLIVNTEAWLDTDWPAIKRLMDLPSYARHTGIIIVEEFGQKGTIGARCLEQGSDEFIRYSCPHSEIAARVRSVLRLKAMTDELSRVNKELESLSLTDELTGLSNMRRFNAEFNEAYKHCLAGHMGLGMIMLDLDHFKSVNDNINHLMGSFVIQEVGRRIASSHSLSTHDIPARYGGDEFIILCPGDELHDTALKADWIRHEIGCKAIAKDSHQVRVTSSVGVAWMPPGAPHSPEELLRTADSMLYKSKLKGRDRVSFQALAA